jgi:hypothetical protein
VPALGHSNPRISNGNEPTLIHRLIQLAAPEDRRNPFLLVAVFQDFKWPFN